MPTQTVRKGTIRMTVQRDVVRYLSVGLYQNFARAIKELVSNAYDALATEVKIRLDLLNDRIIVRDNGVGMDLKDLEEKFLKIGFPTPLTEEVDRLGRKRIGTFGIGSVAIFPYCEKVIVLTKKRDSSENIELDIDVNRFFKGGTFVLGEGEQAKFPYMISPSDLAKTKGETIIILEKIKPHIARELREMRKPKGASIEELSGYDKFRWTLAQYCPLLYPEDSQELREFFEYEKRVPLRLWLDGKELFRNVPRNAKMLEKGEEQFGNVKVKYAIMSPFGPVRPEEAKGLQVRLRDVGIGLPRDFDIIKFTGKVPGKLNYIYGEVHILEGLGNALMIDRDSFSYIEDVSRLEEFFRKKLAKWNELLENRSLHDKELYESLQNAKGSDEVVRELQEASIIQFPKKRLRISREAISKSKRRRLAPASPVTRIRNVLRQDRELRVETVKAKVGTDKPPIEISPDKKTVVIYENHPAFAEKITVFGKAYDVGYSEWDKKVPSICRLESDNKVIYNLSNPLFQSGLSDRVVKELSLGFLVILRNEPSGMKLLAAFEQLLLEIFIS
jgi:hypothetical protein